MTPILTVSCAAEGRVPTKTIRPRTAAIVLIHRRTRNIHKPLHNLYIDSCFVEKDSAPAHYPVDTELYAEGPWGEAPASAGAPSWPGGTLSSRSGSALPSRSGSALPSRNGSPLPSWDGATPPSRRPASRVSVYRPGGRRFRSPAHISHRRSSSARRRAS